MEVFQHQLLTLIGGVICFCTLVKCIRFMKYIFPHIWNALPQTFFRSLGEWAGKGNLPSSCNWVVNCYVTNVFLHFLTLSLQNKIQFPLGMVCLIFFLFSPTNFRFMSLKVLCTWREWKNRQTGNSSHTCCVDVNSLPFPTLMFVLCCKCISFNSTGYILSFLMWSN